MCYRPFPWTKMVENSTNVLPDPEKVELADVQVGKNLPPKVDIHSGWLVIQSRYLRSSTGSCHDLCKYGKKDASEVKKHKPLSRSASATLSRGNHHSLINDVISESKRKDLANNIKPVDQKMLGSPSIIQRKAASFLKKVVEPLRKVQSSGEEVDALANGATTPKTNLALTNNSPRTAFGDSSCKSTNKIKQMGLLQTKPTRSFNSRRHTRKEIEALGDGEIKDMASPSPKPCIRRVASITGRNNVNYRSATMVSNLKREKVRKPEPKKPNNEEVPEKTLYVIEPTEEYKTKKHTQNVVHPTPSSGSRNVGSARQGSLSIQSRLSSDNKILKEYMKPSLSPRSPKTLGSLKRLKEYKRRSLPGIPSSTSAMSPKHVETVKKDPSTDSEAVSNIGPQKGARKECPPEKLSFIRGTVTDVQDDIDALKRLKFRQGRMLGENRLEEGVGRLSFKKREAEDDCQSNATETESEKVILRHQDVQEKDIQSLLNNVIEETVSKLAETRKSKVKALVGAFESVISLQDIKGVTTDTC